MRNAKAKGISIESIAMLLLDLYIITTYIAQDVFLPAVWNSITLYAFLAVSVLYLLLSRTLCVTKMTIWQMAFMIVCLLSMIYSPQKSVLTGSFYKMIINLIFILCLTQYEAKKTVKHLCWSYSISSVILMALLLFTGKLSTLTGRLGTDLMGSATTFARLIMLACMYTLWMLIYGTESKKQRLLLLLFVVIDYIGIFLSGGRKYILVPIVFLYLLLLFKQDRNGKKHIIKYTVLIVAVAGLVLYLVMNVPALYRVIGYRIATFIEFFNGNTSGADHSSIIRSEMIILGLREWLKSPVGGYGFDSFKYYNSVTTGNFYYAHNNFVELLYDLGVVGFVVYYYMYIKMLLQGLRGREIYSNSVKGFVVAVSLSLMLFEMWQVDYSDTTIITMLFAAYSMLSQREIGERTLKTNGS